MIKLVVFDMAGTTVQDDDAVSHAFLGALAGHAIQVEPSKVTAVMGLHKPEAIRLLLIEAGERATPERIEAIHADFVRLMQEHYERDEGVREIPGAGAVFKQLRQAGIKLALNTGFSRQIVDVLLKRLGWGVPGTIDATIASDEVVQGRPAPEMIRALMQRLSIHDASQVAKIGDTRADLEEGTNAGCGMVIGVTSGSYTRDELAHWPHTHLLASVAELPSLVLSNLG